MRCIGLRYFRYCRTSENSKLNVTKKDGYKMTRKNIKTLRNTKFLNNIIQGDTLEEMAKRKPKSNEDFLDITGVGQKKLKQYGTAFLSVIKGSS